MNATMSKKILLIAFFYPPSRSSGVYRALAMGNYLASQGHEVTVLTTTRSFFELESGPPDESLVARIDPRITIIRVPFSTRPIHRSLDLMSRSKARWGPILERLVPRSLRSKLPLFALRSGGSFFLPVRRPLPHLVRPVGEARINDLAQLDAIIATGNPWTSLRRRNNSCPAARRGMTTAPWRSMRTPNASLRWNRAVRARDARGRSVRHPSKPTPRR